MRQVAARAFWRDSLAIADCWLWKKRSNGGALRGPGEPRKILRGDAFLGCAAREGLRRRAWNCISHTRCWCGEGSIRETRSGWEERLRGCMEAGHARTTTWRKGLGRREQAGNFAQLGARGTDDGSGFIESLAGFAGSQRKARLRIGAARLTERMTGSGERIAFTVHEAFDLESHLDIATTIESLAGATLARFELRELRLPEPQDVGFDFANAGYVANFEIETVWNRGLFVDALGGELRGHRLQCRRAMKRATFATRSIGHATRVESRKF